MTQKEGRGGGCWGGGEDWDVCSDVGTLAWPQGVGKGSSEEVTLEPGCGG